ncbi:MAG: hypothetical protein ACOX1P_33575 [Thermoguttaceae bacterium]|jgi:hypothetical protein
MFRLCFAGLSVAASLAALCVCGKAAGQEKDAVPPQNVNKRFEYLVGNWTIEGKVADDAFQAKCSYRWTPGKHGLVTHWSGSFGATAVHGTAVYGWDSKAGEIVDFGFVRELGWRQIRWTPKGENRWEGQMTGVIQGEESQGKIAAVFESDDLFVVTSERNASNPEQVYRYRRARAAKDVKGDVKGEAR